MKASIRNTLRRYKDAVYTYLRYFSGRSDLNRWGDLSALQSAWDERTRLMATLIEPGSSVLEFGAGRMVMKKFLPNKCTYTPSDIVDRGEGTIVCDLNAQRLPGFPPHDVAVLSGVLEYVNDVPRLIAHLTETVRGIVASYVPCESSLGKIERRAHGWVNDFSSSEIEALFAHYGYVLETVTDWQSQKIFKFLKSNAPVSTPVN